MLMISVALDTDILYAKHMSAITRQTSRSGKTEKTLQTINQKKAMDFGYCSQAGRGMGGGAIQLVGIPRPVGTPTTHASNHLNK